jgi:MFS superfamily sulfate permease-like transporter
VVTLATDLLVGVAAGLALKLALHVLRGASPAALFRVDIEEQRSLGQLELRVRGCAVFTNFLALRRRIQHLDRDITRVVIDFTDAYLIDHTVLERIHHIADEWEGCELVVRGLERHRRASAHPRAARHLRRERARDR